MDICGKDSLSEKSKRIAKTCLEVRRRIVKLRRTKARCLNLTQEDLMPYVLHYADKNDIKPRVILRILADGVSIYANKNQEL